MAGDPFGYRPNEIANLTDYQIYKIIFHPRKEDGSLDLSDGPTKVISFKELCKTLWAKTGMTDAEMEARFAKEYPSYAG